MPSPPPCGLGERDLHRPSTASAAAKVICRPRDLALGAFQDATLVPFYPEEIVTVQFLDDETCAFLLAVHRIGGDERALQRGQRVQLIRAPRAGAGELLLVLRQGLRQPAAAQPGAGTGPHFAQIELLGLAVLVVEIAAGEAVALGQTDGLESTGPLTSAAIARLIEETLDQQHGMMPPRLPVVAEAAQG